MEQNQVVRDVEKWGFVGVLTAKDGLILITVAELAVPGENSGLSKAPASIVTRTRAFSSGTTTPERISLALLRMADRGTNVEL